MSPLRRHANVDARPSSAYQRALDAWLSGRYRDCLEILATAAALSPTDHVAMGVLRARVLLGTGAASDGLAALDEAERHLGDTPESADALTTLRGILLCRLGDAGRGLVLLAAPVVSDDDYARAERAYYHAFGLLLARRLDEAERALAPALESKVDRLHAQAVGLLGWLETSRSRYTQAARAFANALAACRALRPRDEHMLASSLHGLGALAPELIDVESALTVEREYREVRWTPDLSVLHSYTLQSRSLWAMLSGQPSHAWRLLHRALAVSSSKPPRIHAHVGMSAVHRQAGETFAARQHLCAAYGLVERVSSATDEDSRRALLEYAAEAARLRDDTANQAIMRYLSARELADSIASLKDDRRMTALERHALGLVTALKDENEAVELLEDAAQRWQALGFRARHAQAAIDLYDLRKSSRLLSAAETATKDAPLGWLRTEIGKRRRRETSREAGLSPALRRVMQAICEGKSARQIAAELGRSVSTVNNQTQAIFENLGVRSRAVLIARYGRRGVDQLENAQL